MALKATYNEAEGLRELMHEAEKIETLIVEAMQMAGETFIRDARNQPQDHASGYYKDVTTNLRNSIQYFIFHNGEEVKSSESISSGANKMKVSAFVKSTGYQLIGIAGMSYASEVESRGLNVISIQADQCIVDLSEYFKDIQKFINGL